MEVYPNFDEKEIITSWNFYAAASYDENKKRFYINKKFAEGTTLDFIASDFESLLLKGFQYLNKIKKEEIPFAVELK